MWVSNEDIGFVHQGQPVKLKFAAFPFQKYGMAEGTVEHVSADAADPAPRALRPMPRRRQEQASPGLQRPGDPADDG